MPEVVSAEASVQKDKQGILCSIAGKPLDTRLEEIVASNDPESGRVRCSRRIERRLVQ